MSTRSKSKTEFTRKLDTRTLKKYAKYIAKVIGNEVEREGLINGTHCYKKVRQLGS